MTIDDSMRTVADARAWAVEELKRAGSGSPSMSADLLLASVLGCDRVRIISHPEQILPGETWTLFTELVFRHAKGEPLQYLTGEREFFGLSFQVKPGVLIPRPETEILVEKAINLILRHPSQRPLFLDVGTGSGCIAVSVAHEAPRSAGCAVDFSPAALTIARANVIRHRVGDRILLVQANLFDCFPPVPRFDFIFCNPPYIPLEDCDTLAPEVRDYEPHLALFGGESGMEFYRKLAPESSRRLLAGGYLLLEAGAGQADAIKALVEAEGLVVETILGDLQGIPRCVVARKTQGG